MVAIGAFNSECEKNAATWLLPNGHATARIQVGVVEIDPDGRQGPEHGDGHGLRHLGPLAACTALLALGAGTIYGAHAWAARGAAVTQGPAPGKK